jgi:hypothetical protein
MTTLRDILTAAQIGETTDWEFKSARGGCQLGRSGAIAKLHPWFDEHPTVWWQNGAG